MKAYQRRKFTPKNRQEVKTKSLPDTPIVKSQGLSVYIREGEDFENMYRRFKKKYTKSGIQYELRDRMYHMTKGEKRRKKQEQARRRKYRETLEENRNGQI